MKKVILGIVLLQSASLFAGHPIASSKKEIVEPRAPQGSITLGGMFSESATGGFIDAMTLLWTPKSHDSALFLDGRYHLEDNGQFIGATGLAYRKLFADQNVIVGANVYWDVLESERDNTYHQLGLGLEVLTKWVDARVNYYLPENDRNEFDRSSSTSRSVNRGIAFDEIETSTRYYKRYESALEGLNAEVGFLIPGLDRYAEVRVFGGYYHYENPFGDDFEGFKARLEARILKGVIADVEYWEDDALMGGNWTAGVRVSAPFSFYNLFTGRNPFEGIGESFTRGPREFESRMDEMIIRSHRIQSTSSGDLPTGVSSSSRLQMNPQPEPVRTVSSSAPAPGFPIE